MAHNVDLPVHRYVWVVPSFVTTGVSEPIPAVWFGISTHPGRALGCHVMLDSGATVIDLPIHALLSQSDGKPISDISDAIVWDCFGWDAEIYQPNYLSGLRADVLHANHKTVQSMDNTAWFAIDWKNNGWSDYPEQHKWMWVLETGLGALIAMPQDRVVFHEESFTDAELPKNGIVRQRVLWSCEK